MEHSNDELKRRTQKNYIQIASSLDPKGVIVDKLFAEDIITFSQVEEINGCHEKEKRAQKLFSFLFETGHSRAFVVFREALRYIPEYSWIVKMIDECEGESVRPCSVSILITDSQAIICIDVEYHDIIPSHEVCGPLTACACSGS